MDVLKLRNLFFILLFLQYSFVTAAEHSYSELILLAAEYQSMSKFKTAALTYEKAFNLKLGNVGDYYNAACSWALAGEKSNAFRNLELALKKGIIPLKHIQNDSDLFELHEDKRWNVLIISLSQRIEQLESSLDQSLVRTLKSIDEKDQRYRKQFPTIGNKHGWDSPEMQTMWKKQTRLDNENLTKLESIINKYGYPGKKLVAHYSGIGFMVVQHSNLKVQERYLPLFIKLADKDDIAWSSVALLVDRVHTTKGEKQVYGTQVNIDKSGKVTVLPVEDYENVDTRRAKVGLPPLSQYLDFIKMQVSPKSLP